MKVAILGSGPSGLLAAWACIQCGVDFNIHSDTRDLPKVDGFKYLHDKCDLPLRKYELHKDFTPYNVDSDNFSKMYSKKIYGDENVSRVSSDFFKTTVDDIYDMNTALAIIHPMIVDNIVEEKLELEDILFACNEYDKVISTLPLHQFYTDLKFTKTYYRTSSLSNNKCDNFVVFNAANNTSWYRYGQIFSRSFIESTLEFPYSNPIIKVTSGKFNFDNMPGNILFTGRYGGWNKQTLVSDVYHEVIKYVG